MTSNLKTMLFAAATLALIGLGNVAAHAGDLDDLADAQQAAAAMAGAAGGDDPISQTLSDPDAASEAVEAIAGVLSEAAE
jgi:hypothetical protein